MKPLDLENRTKELKTLYLRGKISQEQLEVLAEPLLQEANKKIEKISKEHGKKFYPLTLTKLLRSF